MRGIEEVRADADAAGLAIAKRRASITTTPGNLGRLILEGRVDHTRCHHADDGGHKAMRGVHDTHDDRGGGSARDERTRAVERIDDDHRTRDISSATPRTFFPHDGEAGERLNQIIQHVELDELVVFCHEGTIRLDLKPRLLETLDRIELNPVQLLHGADHDIHEPVHLRARKHDL